MSLRHFCQIARRTPALDVHCGAVFTFEGLGSRAFGQKTDDKGAPPAKPMHETLIGQVMQAKVDSGAPTSSLFYCRPDDTVFEAVKKMATANVGSIVVLQGEPSSTDSVAGIITERDYMRNVVVAGKSSKDMYCKNLMTPASKLLTLKSSNSMLEAMNLMEEYNIRHIPIIDAGSLRGMLSIKDVVSTILSDHNAEMNSMKDYIGGSY